jgi:hypothetical protein
MNVFEIEPPSPEAARRIARNLYQGIREEHGWGEHPGPYFTVVQIGLNAVAILGGVVGEGAWSPYFVQFFLLWLSPAAAQTAAFIASVPGHDLAVPGVCRPVSQAAGHEQPGTAGHAHGRPHAGVDDIVEARGVAVQPLHRRPVQAVRPAGAARRKGHLGRHPGADGGRRAGRRAGPARAAGDRQRVRAGHAHGVQRHDAARSHRLVPPRRPATRWCARASRPSRFPPTRCAMA